MEDFLFKCEISMKIRNEVQELCLMHCRSNKICELQYAKYVSWMFNSFAAKSVLKH